LTNPIVWDIKESRCRKEGETSKSGHSQKHLKKEQTSKANPERRSKGSTKKREPPGSREQKETR
jgi:hypothetical protein